MSKPFKQVPVYNTEFIKVPIEEFIELQDNMNVLAESFNLIQQIFFRAINEGDIAFKYVEEDGTEITEDEARKRVVEFNEEEEIEEEKPLS